MRLLEITASDWRRTEHTYELNGTTGRQPYSRQEAVMVNRAKTNRKFARSFPLMDFPVQDLQPTQNWVHRPVVDELIDVPDWSEAKEPVIVARKNGVDFLEDGHHRLVASLLSRRPTLRGYLVDLDQPHGE